MRGVGLDHINILIPEDGVDEALGFYVDVLGLTPMRLEAYRDDERTSFFVRISDDAVINIRPTADFRSPTGENSITSVSSSMRTSGPSGIGSRTTRSRSCGRDARSGPMVAGMPSMWRTRSATGSS